MPDISTADIQFINTWITETSIYKTRTLAEPGRTNQVPQVEPVELFLNVPTLSNIQIPLPLS